MFTRWLMIVGGWMMTDCFVRAVVMRIIEIIYLLFTSVLSIRPIFVECPRDAVDVVVDFGPTQSC